MSAVIDFIKSAMEAGKDRFKSPFARAFTISFVIYNWRPIVFFILSDENVEYRLSYVSEHYSETPWTNYFWIPLASALVYNLVLPHVSYFLEFLLNWVKRNQLRLTEKRKTYLITVTSPGALKRREIELQIENLKLEFKEAQADFKGTKEQTDEINSLQKRIEKLNKELATNEGSDTYIRFMEKAYKQTIQSLFPSLDGGYIDENLGELVIIRNEQILSGIVLSKLSYTQYEIYLAKYLAIETKDKTLLTAFDYMFGHGLNKNHSRYDEFLSNNLIDNHGYTDFGNFVSAMSRLAPLYGSDLEGLRKFIWGIPDHTDDRIK